jgi:AmmeMemoRadiSam system protein B
MDAIVRPTAVAGAFYPGTRPELESQLYSLIPEETARHELLACISPHAGYIYSGGVAGRLFAHLVIPRRVIVLGPNHTGAGAQVAVAPHEGWNTPLGEQPVDTELARLLVDAFPAAELDPRAHVREHSIEVQLPFLMQRREDLEVLPVVLKHLSLDECLDLGHVLAELVGELDEPVGIVASSDMSHFQPDEVTRTLDHMAIDAVLERDPTALFETVHREGITMCGVIPATVALTAANLLGAVDAHLVAYATSGDVSGDYSSVVGYAGVCVHR